MSDLEKLRENKYLICIQPPSCEVIYYTEIDDLYMQNISESDFRHVKFG